MSLLELTKVLRTRWIMIVATIAALGVMATITSALTAPTYQATTRLFVSMASASSVNETYQGGLFAEARVASYAKLITSAALAQRTIEALDLDMSPNGLASKVTATVDPGTVLISVRVKDGSPQQAVEIANSISKEFVTMAAELETPENKPNPSTRVAVFQPADSAVWISPNKAKNLILGLAGGLVLGLLLAIGRDRLDKTVRDQSAIETASASAVVGIIPQDKRGSATPIDYKVADNPTAEAYRRIRTNLTYLDVDNPPRCVVISSPLPDEGKTVTAVNLAYALAESGLSVLIIEADLRRPSASAYLGAAPTVGLTTVLSQQIELDNALQPTAHDGVTLLAAGVLPPNPSELLASVRMQQLLTEARSRYDWIIIDSSPVLPVIDATVLAKASDGVLMLARYGKTTEPQLAQAVDMLRTVGAKVLGTVITFDKTRHKDGYHAYARDGASEAGEPQHQTDVVDTETVSASQTEAEEEASLPGVTTRSGTSKRFGRR